MISMLKIIFQHLQPAGVLLGTISKSPCTEEYYVPGKLCIELLKWGFPVFAPKSFQIVQKYFIRPTDEFWIL